MKEFNYNLIFSGRDFQKTYKEKLDRRYCTFHAALNLLSQIKPIEATILETGCARIKNNWPGDGLSTLLFGEYCKNNNAMLHTVDISEEHISISKEITSEYSDFINFNTMDSKLFISGFDKEIDLLYLDSYDCSIAKISIESQKHQLREIQTAYNKLSHSAIVLLDDNDFENGGKTKLSKEFLIDNGLICILDEYQSLWIRI